MPAIAHSVSLKSIATVLGGGRFSPVSLFSANEPGGWYDPSDLTTLYQNAGGSSPVTEVEQPVGLVLDKSKGLVLGSELVSNGTFDANVNGWQINNTSDASISWDAIGALSLNWTSNSTFRAATSAISVTAGVWYSFSCNVVSIPASVAAGLAVYSTGTPSNIISDALLRVTKGSTGQLTMYWVAPTTGTYYVGLTNGGTLLAGQSIVFDSVTAKSISGNHLSQSTSTARPVLSARYNIFERTQEFSNAYWNKSSLTVTDNTTETTDPIGGNTAGKYVAVGADSGIIRNSIVTAGTWTLSLHFKAGNQSTVAMLVTGSGNGRIANFNLAAKTASIANQGTGGTVSGGTPEITELSNGWFLCQIKNITSSGTNNVIFGGTGANGETFYIWGADLRPSNAGVGLPAYQRVGAATSGSSSSAGSADYDATGFPYYLKFDGTDDSLATGNIDFSGTGKVTLWSGVRKLSDTAYQGIAEFSSNPDTTDKAFGHGASGATGDPSRRTYTFVVRGTGGVEGFNTTLFAAPVTNVNSCAYDVTAVNAADQIKPRVNGVIPTLTEGAGTSTAATAFGTAPLYVGSRGGGGNWFNGHLYSLIVRGAATDAATIASTETWVNQKTLAY